MRKIYMVSSAVGAIAIAVSGGPAMAQEAAAQVETEEAQPSTSGGLNVITVTAQRREESLQDAAIPINAASGAELTATGVTDATLLNRVAPALYVTSGGGANAGYFVRGVGNFTNNGYTNPAVAFNLDGVYVGRPSSTIASFLDVNRVEVLKGPQGTLYGRNATGGAINVIPNRPQLGETSGSVSAGYGNYDAFDVTGVVNLPLGDNVAIRLAATHSSRDGYNTDGTNDADDLALRGQIFAELGDNVDVRLSIDYSTQGGVGPGTTIEGNYAFAPPFVPGRNDLPVPGWAFVPAPESVSTPFTGLHTPESLAFSATVAAAPLFSPFDGYAYPFRDDEYFGVNAEMNFDLGAVDLVVIPAYRRSELDNQFNGPPFKAAINQDVAEQYSIEARLSGEAGPVDWILGAFYFDEQVVGTNSFNQFGTVTHNTYDSNSDSLAFFGRATLNISDDLRLVGGLRYTDDSRSIDAFATATAGVCLEDPVGRAPFCGHVPTIPVGLTLEDSLEQIDPALFPVRNPLVAFNPDGPDGVGQVFPYGPLNYFAPAQFGPGALMIITPNSTSASDGDSEVTYRLAIEYDVTPDSLLYASFENGFRSGGFNLAFGRETYAPEFIDAYTIGSKNRFFDDRLELNAELFYWKYKGQQLAALGVDANGNNAFYTRNVGASTIKGVDIDFQILATETTLIRGGVQYLDAKYKSFLYNQVDLSDETDPPNFLRPVTGCTSTQILSPERSFDIDCSGNQALNSPKWTANIGINQTVELGNLVLTGNVDGRYRGSREVGFNYIPLSRAPSDFTVDASLTLGDIDEYWRITAFVRNLTDEAVPSVVSIGSGNIVSTVYQPPRTYGLRASYNF
jgi:iron complex outermembrane receptor protein